MPIDKIGTWHVVHTFNLEDTSVVGLIMRAKSQAITQLDN